jgi:hypothetical protein
MKNISYKSQLSRYKNIGNRNKKFDSLSAEDKRKEISLDSLNLIMSQKISGSDGTYWNSYLIDFGLKNIDIYTNRKDKKISKIFQKNLLEDLPEECKVCARGALMLSTIRLGNSINPRIDSYFNGSKTSVKGFDMFSFKRMEEEYENDHYQLPYASNTTSKLANILCNIIANGDFNILDKKDYLDLWDLKL